MVAFVDVLVTLVTFCLPLSRLFIYPIKYFTVLLYIFNAV